MSRINLLVITNRYPADKDDGASPFVADFVAGLRRNQIACTVLTPYHSAKNYDEDADVVRFPWGEDRRTIGSLPLWSPISWFRIAAYFRNGYRQAVDLHKQKQFDFCLALWAAPSGLFADRLKKDFNLPYAVWCLGSDIHTYARLPWVGRMVVQVLVDAERVYSDGHQLGQMARCLSGRPYHFLPSLRRIDGEFLPNTVTGGETLVCPGRVEEAKGVFDLLEAFRMIVADLPSWSLVYVGDGSARQTLEKKITAYGLQERVRTLGFLTSTEMFRAVSRAAAVVIPTRSDSLPLTFGEAMQLKRPVIVTDVGDLRHFTDRYKVGLVVPAGSPGLLADAIRRFTLNPEMCGGGFDECVRELDVDLAADKFAGWLTERLSLRSPVLEKVRC
jgi:glycosyltransferase involved in cell wall biosynthesis